MAIVMAIQKWRHYLLGNKFLVKTYQKSLKFLLEYKEVSLEYKKWLIKLLGYNFDIIYNPGVENKAADGLSRMVSHHEVNATTLLLALTVPSTIQLQDIFKGIEEDDKIQGMIKMVKEENTSNKAYSVREGRFFYKKRLIIPRTSKHIPLILREFHDGLQGGHSRMFKIFKMIQLQFQWDKMRMDI